MYTGMDLSSHCTRHGATHWHVREPFFVTRFPPVVVFRIYAQQHFSLGTPERTLNSKTRFGRNHPMSLEQIWSWNDSKVMANDVLEQLNADKIGGVIHLGAYDYHTNSNCGKNRTKTRKRGFFRCRFMSLLCFGAFWVFVGCRAWLVPKYEQKDKTEAVIKAWNRTETVVTTKSASQHDGTQRLTALRIKTSHNYSTVRRIGNGG